MSATTAQRYSDRWRDALARQWAQRLSATCYIPMTRSDVERRLRELIETITATLDGHSDADEAGRMVGADLVAMHATGEESLSATLELLRENLAPGDGNESVRHVLALLASVASGYAGADRESTLAQQETLKRALLRSKADTERDLQFSQERFREMFTTTPVGVAVCDLDGGFVEVNPALEETLGFSLPELKTRTIHDLFQPAEVRGVASAFNELADGTRKRLRERRNLIRVDGSEAWTYVAVSVLRDPDGRPSHFVVMIEDLRELSSLQDRLRHQTLHDSMTGLPNRQHFHSRLELALGKLPKDATLTLYHLGLDGFELINDGLGYDVGDRIVNDVAARLNRLIEGETGLVARFGGTEFAILLRQSPETPDIGSFTALINDELSEPVYVGEHGIATSASIGVTQRTVAQADPNELMWEADVALRHAEAAGKRQWALFDSARAPSECTDARLAVVMPGALELGEFTVVYRPLVSISERRIMAVEARLSWQPEGQQRLGHDECLRLAERSGVTLSLRDWMLRTAWRQLDEWHRAGLRPRMVAGLSPNQARDPDLVASVRSVLDETELDADWMRVCMPMDAMTGEAEEARENVATLSAMGVQTALHDFRAAPGELPYLREIPALAVQLAPDLVTMIHESSSGDSPEARAVAGMIPLVRDTGVPVAVAGIDNDEQARWWLSLGCEIGAGLAYGEPVSADEMARLLESA